MTGHRRLTKSLDNLNTLKQNNPIEFPGILGSQFKGQTLVEVPGRDGYVYVQLRSNLNEVIQAYNSMVSPVYGLPVIVTRDATNNRYMVKGRDLGLYQNWGRSSFQPIHGAQHSFPDNGWGGDIVWIYGRQFTPLCVTPATGTSGGNYVFVNPYVYYLDGIWDYAGGTSTPNLLPYKPTGSGAVPIMVYLDDSGDVQVAVGSNFSASDTTIDTIIPHLPALPDVSSVPLAVIRLTSGTSAISWNEIFDLRPLIGWWSSVTGSTGSGGHTIEDEGTPLTSRSKLNFKGANVWAVDNAGDGATDIIISGSSSSPSPETERLFYDWIHYYTATGTFNVWDGIPPNENWNAIQFYPITKTGDLDVYLTVDTSLGNQQTISCTAQIVDEVSSVVSSLPITVTLSGTTQLNDYILLYGALDVEKGWQIKFSISHTAQGAPIDTLWPIGFIFDFS
jgi:hypothetical protein